MSKNINYTLVVDKNESIYRTCLWNLYLEKEDIDRINYLKEIFEESNKKFNGSGGHNLILGLDVTSDFIPEDKYIYDDMIEIESRLEYVGNDEFVVKCYFVDTCDDPSCIITKRFKI